MYFSEQWLISETYKLFILHTRHCKATFLAIRHTCTDIYIILWRCKCQLYFTSRIVCLFISLGSVLQHISYKKYTVKNIQVKMIKETTDNYKDVKTVCFREISRSVNIRTCSNLLNFQDLSIGVFLIFGIWWHFRKHNISEKTTTNKDHACL